MQLSSARILHFDMENRPITYWMPDRPSAQVTAIAWSWADDKAVNCWLLSRNGSAGSALSAFMTCFDLADMVTGHYIRKHDLTMLNGMLMSTENANPDGKANQ